MTTERYTFLMEDEHPLTAEEMLEGWHFCCEFDGLLVGPGMTELEFCQCHDRSHPVYATTPVSLPITLNMDDLK